jgi:hypothetical protein
VASSASLTSSSYAYSLVPGEYEWFAIAYNACGQNSGPSARGSFTVGQGSACQVPVLLSPANGETCVQAGDTLRWSGAASNYFLRLKSRRCDDHEIAVSGTYYVLGNLSRDEEYYWSVREACECAVASECFSFRSRDRLDRPHLESPSDGANDQPVAGTLAWDPVDDAVAYRVQVGTDCGEGVEVDVIGTSYSYAGLDHARTYFWRVAAIDSCWTLSDYSSCRDFDTAPIVSENRYYYPDGLVFSPGEWGVSIPVHGDNLDALQGFELRIRLDPDVFSFTGVTLEDTRAEGGTLEEVAPDANNGTCRIRVAMSTPCAPGILPGSGALLHVRANVRSDASFGPGSLRFEPAPRTFRLCTGATVNPHTSNNSAQIAGFAGAGATSRPDDLSLEVLGANPFKSTALFRVGMGSAGPATVTVFDLAGRSVATIAEGAFPAGWHAVSWDGHDRSSHAAISGVYIVRLVAGSVVRSQRVTLLR